MEEDNNSANISDNSMEPSPIQRIPRSTTLRPIIRHQVISLSEEELNAQALPINDEGHALPIPQTINRNLNNQSRFQQTQQPRLFSYTEIMNWRNSKQLRNLIRAQQAIWENSYRYTIFDAIKNFNDFDLLHRKKRYIVFFKNLSKLLMTFVAILTIFLKEKKLIFLGLAVPPICTSVCVIIRFFTLEKYDFRFQIYEPLLPFPDLISLVKKKFIFQAIAFFGFQFEQGSLVLMGMMVYMFTSSLRLISVKINDYFAVSVRF